MFQTDVVDLLASTSGGTRRPSATAASTSPSARSDRKRASGHLSHQRPALLRWAWFEAAQCAARRFLPDHAYYLQVAKRIDHNRACLSVARKLCRRAHHILTRARR